MDTRHATRVAEKIKLTFLNEPDIRCCSSTHTIYVDERNLNLVQVCVDSSTNLLTRQVHAKSTPSPRQVHVKSTPHARVYKSKPSPRSLRQVDARVYIKSKPSPRSPQSRRSGLHKVETKSGNSRNSRRKNNEGGTAALDYIDVILIGCVLSLVDSF
jgi:hypothetical protein